MTVYFFVSAALATNSDPIS